MKVKACPQGKRFIEFVRHLNIRAADHVICPKKSKKLRAAGFRMLEYGSFKSVWVHKRYPLYVLKIYRRNTGYIKDGYEVPKRLDKAFLHPIKKTKSYQIQHKVQKVKWGEGIAKFCGMFSSIYDIAPRNIGKFKEKIVVIDFCS